MKSLKLFNGGYEDKYYYIAASSYKQAAELLTEVTDKYFSANYVKNYFNKGCWGNSMNEIIPNKPCVYVREKSFKPTLALIIK